MAEPEKKAEVKKATSAALETRIQESSYMHTTWFYTATPGTKVEDMLDVEYWRHIASKFKPYDLIEAITEDGAWYARFIIVSCDRIWAKVHVLEQHDLMAAAKDAPNSANDDYAVRWKGPIAKYAVIRKSDGAVLKDGFTAQIDGWQFLDSHIKSLAA